MSNGKSGFQVPVAPARQSRLSPRVHDVLWTVGPILVGLLLTTLALVAVGADPLQAYQVMWRGAFGSTAKFGDVMLALVPLLLASPSISSAAL